MPLSTNQRAVLLAMCSGRSRARSVSSIAASAGTTLAHTKQALSALTRAGLAVYRAGSADTISTVKGEHLADEINAALFDERSGRA